VAKVVSHSKPFAARTRARAEKTNAVLRTAAALFLELGYHRATLADVAARLNITKTALYNYFSGKDEILDACYRLGRQLLADARKPIDREGGTGLEKLRKLIRCYAMMAISDFGKCLVLLDDRELPEQSRARVRAQKRSDDRDFRKYIAQGISDGSIAKCDVKLAAFAIAGSLNWIAHWYRESGSLSAEKVADEFAILLTNGVATRDARHLSAADRFKVQKVSALRPAQVKRVARARKPAKSAR